MDFVVLTIFPEMVEPFLRNGMIKRAVDRELISGTTINIRDYAHDRHQVTDDKPYGGGCGMIMKPEPLKGAIEAAEKISPKAKKILLTPQGRKFDQKVAEELSHAEGLILVCGRYEGVDERIGNNYIDEEISIGDFVLTGGELGAMVLIDSVARLLPGVLGGETSATMDSFSNGLLEHAHYTRPPVFGDALVPEILLSGNHGKIAEYREKTSLIRTFLKRPDLLADRAFSEREKAILKSWSRQVEQLVDRK